MTKSHAVSSQNIDAATAKTSKQRTVDALIQASPSVLLLRDGELVLYRRTRSLLYQCRFKLADGKWHRFSTRKASLENAIAAACDMYDEARYRQRLGLAHRTHTFAQIAAITLAEMRQQIDLSTGKTAPPPGPARNRPLTGQHSCRQPAKVIVVKQTYMGSAGEFYAPPIVIG